MPTMSIGEAVQKMDAAREALRALPPSCKAIIETELRTEREGREAKRAAKKGNGGNGQ